MTRVCVRGSPSRQFTTTEIVPSTTNRGAPRNAAPNHRFVIPPPVSVVEFVSVDGQIVDPVTLVCHELSWLRVLPSQSVASSANVENSGPHLGDNTRMIEALQGVVKSDARVGIAMLKNRKRRGEKVAFSRGNRLLTYDRQGFGNRVAFGFGVFKEHEAAESTRLV